MSSSSQNLEPMSAGARQNQLEAVLDRVIKARAQGERISDRQIIEQHADLLPELEEELKYLRSVAAAKLAAGKAARPEGAIDLLAEAQLNEPVEHSQRPSDAT